MKTPLMRTCYVTCILVLLMAWNSSFGQGVVIKRGRSLQVFGFHGTWDKTRHPERAQFGGNNRLLNGVFNEYFKGPMIGPSINEKAEATFIVDTLGNIDTILFSKRFTEMELNVLVMKVIEYTSGKWRPAIINGKKAVEEITVYLQFYNDWNKQTMDGLIKKARNEFDAGQYEKALKPLDEILIYDCFNVEASVLKGKSHIKLMEIKQACELWNNMLKFEYPEIESLVNLHCK